MANPEHLAILEQGVKVWNEWREKNPDIRPDFSGADFVGANLRGAILTRADLHKTHIFWADLTGAFLEDADLSGANLDAAKLRDAHLKGADLSSANLTDADLSGAQLFGADLITAGLIRANLTGVDLSGAHLIFADLSEANINRAMLNATIFADIDLSKVKGLETVEHRGPSEISISSIYKSGGNIPEAFLRGCGVPENFITYMHSLANQPKAFEFYSAFISYSSKDNDFAERLHADLQASHVRVWFAPEDLKIGARIRPGIDEAVRAYDKLLLVLSKTSVSSQWVEQEVETALEPERKEKRTILFPIRLDSAVMKVKGGWPRHDSEHSQYRRLCQVEKPR